MNHAQPSKNKLFINLGLAAILGFGFLNSTHAAKGPKTIKAHAIAIYGKPKHPVNMAHLDYADPKAVKGGNIVLSDIGGFDSLNMFSVKGNPAPGLVLIHSGLTSEILDDPTTEYCVICETIEYPEDRSWVRFHLNPKARFSDGSPLTAADVEFSFNTLSKNFPPYRGYYADVLPPKVIDAKTIHFDFKKPNNELPVILGQLRIISKKYWETKDITKTTLETPVSSGPYMVKAIETGRSITYGRVKDYWAQDIPHMRGVYNFDEIRYDSYGDEAVAHEGFKGGAIDFWVETSVKNWAQGYDFEGFRKKLAVKELIPDNSPTGYQGFVFNIRRPIFADRRVREAIGLVFNFEWMNDNFFFNAYSRNESYFENSEFKAGALPDKAELKILEPYKATLPPEVFTKVFKAPVNKTEEDVRNNIKRALALLEEAGWKLKDGVLKNAAGEAFQFEMVGQTSTLWERVLVYFQKSLTKLGMNLKIRTMDQAQYVNRMNNFDFDMALMGRGESDSPGNEQREFWGSAAAKQKGSSNWIGIQDPAIDAIIEALVTSKTRDALVTHTRALDRILLWQYYGISHWYAKYDRIAYWDKFGKPKKNPPRGASFVTWWIDPTKEANLKKARGR